jgi:hypothetical protein
MNEKYGLWFGNLFLAGILALLMTAYFRQDLQPAEAYAGWETDGIMCIATGGNARLVLVDTKKKNICLYRTLGAGDLRLVGARGYQYDVEMMDGTQVPAIQQRGITYVEAKQIYDKFNASSNKAP